MRARTGTWRESHVNRVDVSPGKVGPPARYNQPMVLMDGEAGGRLWNFYQENWEYQGPKYRHLLVRDTTQPLTKKVCSARARAIRWFTTATTTCIQTQAASAQTRGTGQ